MPKSKTLLLGCIVFAFAAAAYGAPRTPKPLPPNDSIKFETEHEEFDDSSTEDWKLNTLEYSHKYEKFGSVILRATRADRFGTDGMQYELDVYPKIRKGMYAYINVGVSGSSLFPERRYGAQIWKSLPKSYEASIGVRYLAFDDAVTVWTGSIGRYKGNYYYVLTPYVVDGDDGTSATGVVEVRRYFGDDTDNVLTFRGSYGNAPDVDTLLQISTTLDNWSLSMGRDWVINRGFVIGGEIGYRDREYNINVERQSVFVKGSLRYRF